jgi:uncharacterized protein (DUF58 family)
MKLARLNHILIPATRQGRDRLRRGVWGKGLAPLLWLFRALSTEGGGLLVLTLFVGTAGIEVGRTQVYFLWSALVGLLAGALVARPFFRMRNVSLSVSTPPRVTMGDPIQFTLTLANRADRDHHGIRLGRPFLPWDGEWVGAPPRIRSLAKGGSVSVQASARFIERGTHYLDPFSAAVAVPLGLSLGRCVYGAGCRFNVVPRIAPVASIRLPHGQRYQPGGVAQASSMGEAMELRGVRPYRPGDPIRDLHARTWARTGVPHIREYQQEYFTRIGVVFDDDATTLTDAGLEASLSLAAGVIAKLSRGEALIDLLVVGSDVHSFTIGRSLGFLPQALDVLACVQPGEVLDSTKLVQRIEPYLAALSCIVLITQSDDTSRATLADEIERRGVSCRVLRVHDDTTRWWQPTKAEVVPRSRGPRERLITVSRIESQEPLVL